jgi:hypothetical protein
MKLITAFYFRPIQLDRHLFYIPGETDKEQEIKHSSAIDWMNFLLARSAEMKKGKYKIRRLYWCIFL